MKNLFLVTLGQFSQVGNWSRDGLSTAVSVVVKDRGAVLLENSSTAIRVKTRVVSILNTLCQNTYFGSKIIFHLYLDFLVNVYKHEFEKKN